MSTSIENNTSFNPYAAPIGASVQPQHGLPYRAPLKLIKQIDRLAIVADLSYLANCCSFGLAVYFLQGEVVEYSMIAFYASVFLLWYSVVAGLFRAKGFSMNSILTPFLLPIPIVGTFCFLFAKEQLREFMIDNGYRPRFLGFAADKAQRQAMDQDRNYTPSQSIHLDGSRRRHVYSLSECCLILCFGGYVLTLLCLLISSHSSFLNHMR